MQCVNCRIHNTSQDQPDLQHIEKAQGRLTQAMNNETLGTSLEVTSRS